MNIQITAHKLSALLQAAAEMGALQALASTGKVRPYLNRAQAFRRYGRVNTERWIAIGLISPVKDGEHSASWRIDLLQAESIAKAWEALPVL